MAKKKILVVDDEAQMVAMVKIRLEANDYEVLTAYDGQQGFEVARKEKPDIIILDIMLPKMDGYKVCGLLKADARYNKIPIILFTAKAQESDIIMAKEAGANAYIMKPFESQTLLAKIKELIKD